jgi:hypothetical protein
MNGRLTERSSSVRGADSTRRGRETFYLLDPPQLGTRVESEEYCLRTVLQALLCRELCAGPIGERIEGCLYGRRSQTPSRSCDEGTCLLTHGCTDWAGQPPVRPHKISAAADSCDDPGTRTVFVPERCNNYRLASLLRMAGRSIVVDVHTHVYPPRYLALLRARTALPRIQPGPRPSDPERLIILPDEDKAHSTSSGRPVGREYYDINVKLSFMKRHSIDISVIRFQPHPPSSTFRH